MRQSPKFVGGIVLGDLAGSLVRASSLVSSQKQTLQVPTFPVHEVAETHEKVLKCVLTISTVLMSFVVVLLLLMCLSGEFGMSWSGLRIGFITD